MTKPLVSIIIPAYNEEAVLPRLLRSIKKQTYKHIETIVVDDCSSDKTALVAKKFTNKVIKKTKRTERSATRNFGANKAKGKYLLFLDADMELTRNVVNECIKMVSTDTKIGGVVIPEKSVAKTFWEKVKAFERSFYALEGDDKIEAARFFSKTAFHAVGGYDLTLTGPEDWLLPESIKEQGNKILRANSTLLYHYERIPTIWSLAKKKYYYALQLTNYLRRTKTRAISAKTVYFMRPVFYKHWRKLLSQPVMSLAMFIMFTIEISAGGIGYIIGKSKYESK